MNILLAFSDLSPTLSADEAGLIAQEALLHLHPNWSVRTLALSGGGPGFARAMCRTYFGKFQSMPVIGLDGEPVPAEMGVVAAEKLPENVRQPLRLSRSGKVALIDAACVGARLPGHNGSGDAWSGSSYGVGQLIGKAADEGVSAILLGVDGMASLDLGLGALEAIGLEFLSESLDPMHHLMPKHWLEFLRFTGEVWPHIPPIYLVTDGDTMLLGPGGTVPRYGKACGLSTVEAIAYERAFGGMAKRLGEYCDKPRTVMTQRGIGEGGGLAYGLHMACDAELMPAETLVPPWQCLDAQLDWSEIVVLGGERIDRNAMERWPIGGLLRKAKQRSRHCFVFGGSIRQEVILPDKSALIEVIPPGTTVEKQRSSERKLLAKAISRVFKS